MNGWFVYILRCIDQSLYVGISNDVEQRMKRHNDGYGAEYTSIHRPVILIWTEPAESEIAARRRERRIKGWSRLKKEKLDSRYKGLIPLKRVYVPESLNENEG